MGDLNFISIDDLQGVWRVVSYEEDGVPRSNEAVQRMACLLIASDPKIRGSDGVWGVASYAQEQTDELIKRSFSSLACLIRGLQYERYPDFHIFTGGLVYLNREEHGNSIDVLLYHGENTCAQIAEQSVNLGIYRIDETRLTLCLADAQNRQRPTQFDSTQTGCQSLAVYVRDGVIRL